MIRECYERKWRRVKRLTAKRNRQSRQRVLHETDVKSPYVDAGYGYIGGKTARPRRSFVRRAGENWSVMDGHKKKQKGYRPWQHKNNDECFSANVLGAPQRRLDD